MNARTAKEPSLAKLVSELKAAGHTITRAGYVNNVPAYKVDNKPGLFVKNDLLALAGYGA